MDPNMSPIFRVPLVCRLSDDTVIIRATALDRELSVERREPMGTLWWSKYCANRSTPFLWALKIRNYYSISKPKVGCSWWGGWGS